MERRPAISRGMPHASTSSKETRARKPSSERSFSEGTLSAAELNPTTEREMPIRDAMMSSIPVNAPAITKIQRSQSSA